MPPWLRLFWIGGTHSTRIRAGRVPTGASAPCSAKGRCWLASGTKERANDACQCLLGTYQPGCCFRSEGRDHPSSLSPGKLAADIEGFFCAESKMTFQKSVFAGLDVFKHVESLGWTQIELLGILSLSFAAKLNAFKKLNEDISYCHPLPQQP